MAELLLLQGSCSGCCSKDLLLIFLNWFYDIELPEYVSSLYLNMFYPFILRAEYQRVNRTLLKHWTSPVCWIASAREASFWLSSGPPVKPLICPLFMLKKKEAIYLSYFSSFMCFTVGTPAMKSRGCVECDFEVMAHFLFRAVQIASVLQREHGKQQKGSEICRLHCLGLKFECELWRWVGVTPESIWWAPKQI